MLFLWPPLLLWVDAEARLQRLSKCGGNEALPRPNESLRYGNGHQKVMVEEREGGEKKRIAARNAEGKEEGGKRGRAGFVSLSGGTIDGRKRGTIQGEGQRMTYSALGGKKVQRRQERITLWIGKEVKGRKQVILMKGKRNEEEEEVQRRGEWRCTGRGEKYMEEEEVHGG